MKRSPVMYIVLLLFGLSLLCGCDSRAGALINGKVDLPIPKTILLRNNETGFTREFTSADEEFDCLYDALNARWGMYGDKKELCYYGMKYTFSSETPPAYEAEFLYTPGSIPSWHIPWSDKTSDDVIGVVIALDKGANKAAYIFHGVEDFRDVTALVYEPTNDTLEYVLSLLEQ